MDLNLSGMKGGGESGIRTHGSFESPVFKTGSLNHSDISPHLFQSEAKLILPYLGRFVKGKRPYLFPGFQVYSLQLPPGILSPEAAEERQAAGTACAPSELGAGLAV